jgi:drug/metabolite transporter (DMT)-like permease
LIYVKLFLTALFWGGTFIAGRQVSQNHGPFTIAFLRFTMASALLLSLTWLKEGRLPGISLGQLGLVILLGMTGVFGTVIGFVWFYQGVQLLGTTRAGLFINLIPISAVILAFLLLQEPMTWSLAVGAALVLSGVYLTNRTPATPRSGPNDAHG